jgi:hypothetical protein
VACQDYVVTCEKLSATFEEIFVVCQDFCVTYRKFDVTHEDYYVP